jgi:hypothetical protein
MAKPQGNKLTQFSVQGALNATTGVSGGWDNQTKQTVAVAGGETGHIELNSTTHIVMMQPTVDTQFSFTVAETDIDADDDLHISAGVLTSIVVPRGLGNTINLNFVGLGVTGFMKVVEV